MRLDIHDVPSMDRWDDVCVYPCLLDPANRIDQRIEALLTADKRITIGRHPIERDTDPVNISVKLTQNNILNTGAIGENIYMLYPTCFLCIPDKLWKIIAKKRLSTRHDKAYHPCLREIIQNAACLI